jgi:hypothetical protein
MRLLAVLLTAASAVVPAHAAVYEYRGDPDVCRFYSGAEFTCGEMYVQLVLNDDGTLERARFGLPITVTGHVTPPDSRVYNYFETIDANGMLVFCQSR